jgi:hypothetical protein
VQDFQDFILVIRGLMAAVDELDDVTLPASAAALWNSRQTPADSRNLDDLVAEYEADVASGAWTPAARMDVIFPDLSNPHCDYLPEFPRIREGITDKNHDREDKTDIDAWLRSMLTDCPALAETFQQVIDDLLLDMYALQLLLDGTLADALDRLNGSIPGQDQTAFADAFAQAYATALAAGAFADTNPPPNNVPGTQPGCEAVTDPLAAAINARNAALKDLQDQVDFAATFPCDYLAL